MNVDLPLHPIVVHFPIALLLTGLLLDLAGLVSRREWLPKAALTLLVLGALGSFAAVRTGEAAEDAILETPAIEQALELHEDAAKPVMWVFLVLAAARGGLVAWGRYPRLAAWIFVIVWAAGCVLLVRAAWYGGRLVYDHGAGVAVSPAAHGAPPRPHGGAGGDD